MRRRAFLAGLLGPALGAGLGSTSASAAVAPLAEQAPRAWVGATLWAGDGQIIEDATVVVSGERISVAAKAAPVPSGARVVHAHGFILTPGWVAVETALGLVELELERSTLDAEARTLERPDAIHAAYSAADAYNPRSSLIGVARREGVTHAVATPRGGLVSGTSAWVELIDRFPGRAVLREDLAVHANLCERRESSRPLALSRLRNALESARLYARSPQAYDQGQARELGLAPEDLRRIARVVGGNLPLVVRVARGVDILRLLELAESYQLRLILSGVEEGWTVAAQLAAAHVPVIVDPSDSLPASFSALSSRRDNAALLGNAGVPLIFASLDAYGAYNLRQLAGIAVASGASRTSALRALAFEPANAFGMGNDYGLLAPGRLASFCVWTGDPFELGTWAEDVVIRGRSVSTRSRQNELFDRYRDLSRVPRGRAGLPPSGG
ncbi:MAG: amidohydrolase family protein [Deltaproteobacteria bacterium]